MATNGWWTALCPGLELLPEVGGDWLGLLAIGISQIQGTI